jgi:hypothetical protein
LSGEITRPGRAYKQYGPEAALGKAGTISNELAKLPAGKGFARRADRRRHFAKRAVELTSHLHQGGLIATEQFGMQRAPRELLQLQDVIEIGAGEPAAHMIQAAVIDAMGVDHTQDLIGVRAQMLRQANLLGQMKQHEQRAVESHLGYVDVGDGSGKHGFSINLLAQVPQEALHDLAFDPAALDLGQIDLAALFIFTDVAHVVSNIPTTVQGTTTFEEKDNSS